MPRALSSLLANVGKKATFGRYSTMAAVGVGVGAALASEDVSTRSFDYMSEVLLGDPQADRAILGTDVGWGAMMGFDPNPIHHIGLPPMQYLNSTIIGDAFRVPDEPVSSPLAATVIREGRAASDDYNVTNFSAPPSRRRSMNGPSGDIVFGAYNLRMG